MEIQIVFRNELFLVVDKPPGFLSAPSRRGPSDPRPELVGILAGSTGARVWPVHRLDQAVTGALLYARTADSHRTANAWFERRQIRKSYEALTEGPEPREAVSRPVRWESRIRRGKKRAFESPSGKPALTEVQWLGTVDVGGIGLQHWSITALTGRPHQIRFELSRRGFPVWGDALYGAERPLPVPGCVALRAVRLDFSGCPEAPRCGLPAALAVEPLLPWLESAGGC